MALDRHDRLNAHFDLGVGLRLAAAAFGWRRRRRAALRRFRRRRFRGRGRRQALRARQARYRLRLTTRSAGPKRRRAPPGFGARARRAGAASSGAIAGAEVDRPASRSERSARPTTRRKSAKSATRRPTATTPARSKTSSRASRMRAARSASTRKRRHRARVLESLDNGDQGGQSAAIRDLPRRELVARTAAGDDRRARAHRARRSARRHDEATSRCTISTSHHQGGEERPRAPVRDFRAARGQSRLDAVPAAALSDPWRPSAATCAKAPSNCSSRRRRRASRRSTAAAARPQCLRAALQGRAHRLRLPVRQYRGDQLLRTGNGLRGGDRASAFSTRNGPMREMGRRRSSSAPTAS